MTYVVTFAERMMHDEQRWIEGSRIFHNLEDVVDFLEVMYEAGEGWFRDAHIWSASEIEHRVRMTTAIQLKS